MFSSETVIGQLLPVSTWRCYLKFSCAEVVLIIVGRSSASDHVISMTTLLQKSLGINISTFLKRMKQMAQGCLSRYLSRLRLSPI